jgi:hypothetical protein
MTQIRSQFALAAIVLFAATVCAQTPAAAPDANL